MEKMVKKMLIDATHPEETRVVVADGNKIDEFDFESKNKKQISGNIYLAKISRIEPSLQAAFVEYGGNRHGFLAYSEIHPDYYQIPIADREALIAEELGVPFIYVRASAKSHGKGQRIEGDFTGFSSVFVIEDLISTGKSSLSAVDALRDAGLEVKGLLAFFTYGFPDAVERFAEKECPFFTLTDYSTMLEVACRSEYITDSQKIELDGWSADPVTWSNKHQAV